jgi:hypothetical protein
MRELVDAIELRILLEILFPRNNNDTSSAGSQNTPNLAKHRVRIKYMLEDIGTDDDVKTRGLKWQRFTISTNDPVATLRCRAQISVRQVYPDNATRSIYPLQDFSLRAADIQDSLRSNIPEKAYEGDVTNVFVTFYRRLEVIFSDTFITAPEAVLDLTPKRYLSSTGHCVLSIAATAVSNCVTVLANSRDV